MKSHALTFVASVLMTAATAEAEVKISMGYSAEGAGFTFENVPSPANNDAATSAKFIVVEGTRDPNGGDAAVLHDGRAPAGADQPAQNFFFRAGSEGGRVQVDLGAVVSVKQVCSYSWHAGMRGPQLYKLYAAEGRAAGFNPAPGMGIDPASAGWQMIATVDTRPKDGDGGGQHGVAIADTTGVLGKFRYLLFEIQRTESRDAFGNTFYSEIDVIDANGPPPVSSLPKPIVKPFATADGKWRFAIDATEAPDLMEWAETQLAPVVREWYPRIAALLPSDGFQAPAQVTLRFQNDMGKVPASAWRMLVNLNTPWFRGELKREAIGAVVHELVHIVQAYSREPAPAPGWLTEGIADYVRWFLYEPQSKGAEITKANLAQARYDASYRISANFLDWVTRTYDRDIVRKLNAAAREGRYRPQLWQEFAGKPLEVLGEEWRALNARRLGAS